MEYKFLGIELTPTVFQELLIKLFDGKQFSRKEAINTITKYHAYNGGILNKSSYISVFKKASQKLKNSGISNIGYGVWKLTYTIKETKIYKPQNNQKQLLISSDKNIGTGKNAIYVYYYDSYKKLSELQGKEFWECKIGRTDINPISRIIGQASTSYPELPHIALIIYCDNSGLLERTIHDILKIKQRWLSNSPGKEWFFTSPEEIEQIYYSVVKA